MKKRTFLKASGLLGLAGLVGLKLDNIKIIKMIFPDQAFSEDSILQIKEIRGVKRYLSNKVKKFYDNMVLNTVIEYVVDKNGKYIEPSDVAYRKHLDIISKSKTLIDYPNKDTYRRCNLVQFMGLTVEHSTKHFPAWKQLFSSNSDLRYFISLINEAADKDLICMGSLVKVCSLELASLNKNRELIWQYSPDWKFKKQKDNQPHIYRTMLLYYPVGVYEFDQIKSNEAMGKRVFLTEAELAPTRNQMSNSVRI